jgi:hypothetical protein
VANTNKPFGFRPVGKSGSNYNSAGRTAYPISSNYGTAIYNGDIVTLASGYLAAGTTSNAIVGVFQGCEYTDPTTKRPPWSNYYPGSIVASDIVAYVVDDPNQQFLVQVLGVAAVTCIGRNALTDTSVSGSTVYGLSGQQLGTPATGNATYTWKIVGVYDAIGDNDVLSAYSEVIVIPNNHLYKGGTGTAGV